jgi:uncharacterized membrane protein
MTQGENTIINGGGSQTGGLARWGDYSSLAVDPTDDCTFFHANEYLKASGSFNWSTRIASFKLPSCPATPPTPDFSLSVTPSSATVTQGSSATYTVNITRTGGFTGAVTLGMSSSPSGLTGTFSPNPATGASSTLTVPTTTSTAVGPYTITVTGTGTGVPTHTATTSLTVNAPATPDFSLSVTPSSATVTQGSSATYTVNITRTGGFTGAVSLSFGSSPSGLTGTFAPNPATGATSTLTVPTTTATATGTYTITVTGTGSGVPTHTATTSLTVNPPAAGDFSLSVSPASLSIKQGTSGTYTVSVTRTGGFTGAVQLSVSGLPSGVTAVFSPNPATGTTSTLTVTATATAATGSFALTITGTSGTLSRATSATLVVTQGCVNGNGDC